MTRLRVAVIGAGHLGRIHMQLLKQLPEVETVAVVDPDPTARDLATRDHQVLAAARTDEVLDQIDAAIVAAPTSSHYELGAQLLARKIHVLMEKPLAASSAEANALVELAAVHGCVLTVGHVERFNPVVRAVSPLLTEPKYIEARRVSGFTFRSTDIGVVFDLMVHDLDLILRFVRSKVVQIQALGLAVLGEHEDMAQARLLFQNGCVANLTASRTAMQPLRSMSVYCPSLYAGIDFANRTVNVVQARSDVLDGSFDLHTLESAERIFLRDHLFETLFQREPLAVANCNPLQEELRDFVGAILEQRTPLVSGEHGRDAVVLAERICEAIDQHAWNGDRTGPRGRHAVAGPSILKTPTIQPETPVRRKAG